MGRAEPRWLHPDDDLAPNRPGEVLRGRDPGPSARGWRWAAGRLLGRTAAVDAWRAQLAGEQRVGASLDQCAAAGWRVLHSLPLPGQAVLPHLAIGPGGVFCLHTAHHPGSRVWVGQDAVRIGPRRWEPYVRLARRSARGAGHALGRRVALPVAPHPVLVVTQVRQLRVTPQLRDVWVLREQDLAALARRGGVLRPDQVKDIHAAARDRRTWLAG